MKDERKYASLYCVAKVETYLSSKRRLTDSSHIFMPCLYFRLNSKDEFVELMSSHNGDNKHYLRSGTRGHTGRRVGFKLFPFHNVGCNN